MRVLAALVLAVAFVPSPARADASARAPSRGWRGVKELRAGCFAWSAKRRAVACVTGKRQIGGDSTDAWQVTFLGADVEPIKLPKRVDSAVIGHEGNTWGLASSAFPLDGDARRRLLAALSDGAYVPLDFARAELKEREAVTFGAGSAKWNGANKLRVRCRGDRNQTIDDALDLDFAPPAAGSVERSVQAIAIPRTPLVLFEARLGYGMEGEYENELTAVLFELDACKVRASSPPAE